MASSSSPQQPFPYLDDTCILWCTPSDTANIKQWLANQDALFFGSFLNECAKTIDLSGDHWRSKDAGGLTREQSAVYKCLRARPINFEALVAIMQSYAEGKFRRGITKGVVDLSDGDVGGRDDGPLMHNTIDDQTYNAAQLTLYNKVFTVGERETHRKQRELDAGLTPLQRPHPGLEKVRRKRQAGTERRKKRKFGDKSGEDGDGDGEDEEALNTMRKMKKGLPTYTFADEEAKIEGKSHGKLVFTGKGKGKMEDEDEIE
ncbi:hypothetical protein D6C95_09902 [Aureobasidium pullulans]|nr:hypothetical protein D6C95_09902 [Aureobasidium pullulans]